jgi:hypothetical protein
VESLVSSIPTSIPTIVSEETNNSIPAGQLIEYTSGTFDGDEVDGEDSSVLSSYAFVEESTDGDDGYNDDNSEWDMLSGTIISISRPLFSYADVVKKNGHINPPSMRFRTKVDGLGLRVLKPVNEREEAVGDCGPYNNDPEDYDPFFFMDLAKKTRGGRTQCHFKGNSRSGWKHSTHEKLPQSLHPRRFHSVSYAMS